MLQVVRAHGVAAQLDFAQLDFAHEDFAQLDFALEDLAQLDFVQSLRVGSTPASTSTASTSAFGCTAWLAPRPVSAASARETSSSPAAQCGTVTVSSIIVTAPLRASARPSSFTPSFIVMDVSARMLPANAVVVPSVAELPTFQKTLHACAPLTSLTRLADALISVEPAWKTTRSSDRPARRA
jgi:hypothetical protein